MSRKYRPTLYQKWTAKKVMSVQDSLDAGTLMFSANEQGNDSVIAYIDFDSALTLCTAVLGGAFSIAYPSTGTRSGVSVTGKLTKFGGSKSSQRYNGGVESRILEIVAGTQEGLPKWIITIKNSEGEISEKTGMITPKVGSNAVSQTLYFTHEEILLMCAKIKLHMEAYYNKYMLDLYDDSGNWNTGRADDFTTASALEYRAAKAAGNTNARTTSVRL